MAALREAGVTPLDPRVRFWEPFCGDGRMIVALIGHLPLAAIRPLFAERRVRAFDIISARLRAKLGPDAAALAEEIAMTALLAMLAEVAPRSPNPESDV